MSEWMNQESAKDLILFLRAMADELEDDEHNETAKRKVRDAKTKAEVTTLQQATLG